MKKSFEPLLKSDDLSKNAEELIEISPIPCVKVMLEFSNYTPEMDIEGMY